MANTVSKNKTANAGRFAYKYVDIAQIHEYLESIGMSYYQYIDRVEGDDYVITVPIDSEGKELNHRRGSRVVQATLQGTSNPAQEQGSALTYARRYSLLMAFGLATDDDDAQKLSRPKTITPQQVAELTSLIEVAPGKDSLDVRIGKVCASYGINRLEDLTTDQYEKLKHKLGG